MNIFLSAALLPILWVFSSSPICFTTHVLFLFHPQCTKQKTWKDIAAQLGIGASSSGAYTLKKHYGKNLLPFECYYDRGGIDPAPILAQVFTGNPFLSLEQNTKIWSPWCLCQCLLTFFPWWNFKDFIFSIVSLGCEFCSKLRNTMKLCWNEYKALMLSHSILDMLTLADKNRLYQAST